MEGIPDHGKSRRSLLSVLGLWVPAIVLLANITLWVSTVQGMGGPEVLVRRTDFVSGLTGATLIRDGNGQNLYDLQTQHNAQAEIFKPYLILAPTTCCLTIICRSKLWPSPR